MTERGSLFYTRCGTFHKGMDNLNGLHFFLKCYIVKVRFGGRIKRLQARPILIYCQVYQISKEQTEAFLENADGLASWAIS